jgi:fatty acid CoA ligase FadD9
MMAEIEPDRPAYVDRRRNMLKLTQSDFVAATRLEAVYAGASLIQQIFVHRYGERSILLAVVVPTPIALAEYGNSPSLKAALRQSLDRAAAAAGLQSYEMPVDIFVEPQPFTDE